MQQQVKSELLGTDSKELTALVENLGQPAYRWKQLFEALYRQRVTSLEEVSTLPKETRQQLAEAGYKIGLPEVEKRFVSVDGTVRYLFNFPDGESVEAVWMPEGDGGEAGDGSEAGLEEESTLSPKRRLASGDHLHLQPGWLRRELPILPDCVTWAKGNLTAGEIVGQVNSVLNDHGVDLKTERINLVFMGQGEPFLNYDNLMKAVRLLSETGVGIPDSRMTISTSGIVPRIYDFAKEEVRPKLAISLNAPNDVVREKVMPINRKWNIEAL